MGRNVFISILGTSFYRKSIYERESPAFKAKETRFIQLATLELLNAEEWDRENSLIVIGLTEGARKSNWNLSTADKPNQRVIPNPNTEVKEWEEYIGLRDELSTRFPGIPVKECSIPDGKDEKEIMEIFSRIFSFIGKEDRLYFDLTHGFRYLPMLVTVLAHYSRFIYPEVTIKHMSYGNFELKNKNGNCTFIDLMPLHLLQDWTFAAGQYKESGRIYTIKSLTDNQIRPLLRQAYETKVDASVLTDLKKYVLAIESVINSLVTCRGIDVTSGALLENVQKYEECISSVAIEPLQPILACISKELSGFTPRTTTANGFYAAKWCFEKKLFQQAITILQETIITHLCLQEGLNWKSEDEREVIENALHFYYRSKDEPLTAPKQDNAILFEKAKENATLQRVAKYVKSIKDLRNDFNHFGIRVNPQNSSKIISNIKSKIQHIEELFSMEECARPLNVKHFFINLSNHPSSSWSEKQLAAAHKYGEILDIDFPQIEDSCDEEEIRTLVSVYCTKIINTTHGESEGVTIHIMGEMTFTYALVKELTLMGYTCVASTSKRIVEEHGDGTKTVKFEFCKFRRYE